MKRILLILCMLTASVSSQAQQKLWISDNKAEIISKVHELYNQYEYYYDLTGYDMKTYNKEFDTDLSFVTDFTTLATKHPAKGGSRVCVLSVSKDRVDEIVFSNTPYKDFRPTYEFEWPKFRSWYSDVLAGHQ